MQRRHLFLATLAIAAFGSACGNSSTEIQDQTPPIFSDDFESGLTQWVGRPTGYHAQIVEDPLVPGNHVVNFTQTVAAGDIFTIPIPVDSTEVYTLTFDYLGLPQEGSIPGNLGGFIGVITGDVPGIAVWLYGPAKNPAAHLHDLIEDGQWRTYSVQFKTTDLFETTDGTIRITLEDGEGVGSVPGDAYFDNVKLTPHGS